jgi:hypothetical protein
VAARAARVAGWVDEALWRYEIVTADELGRDAVRD